MTRLLQRMIEDMQVRNLAPHTADSDDIDRAFRTDVGHLFRLKSAGHSD